MSKLIVLEFKITVASSYEEAALNILERNHIMIVHRNVNEDSTTFECRTYTRKSYDTMIDNLLYNSISHVIQI